jgi:hypothetical protein
LAPVDGSYDRRPPNCEATVALATGDLGRLRRKDRSKPPRSDGPVALYWAKLAIPAPPRHEAGAMGVGVGNRLVPTRELHGSRRTTMIGISGAARCVDLLPSARYGVTMSDHPWPVVLTVCQASVV